MLCLQHSASTPLLITAAGRLCLHTTCTACPLTGDTLYLQRSAGNMDENAVGEKIAGLKRELGFWDKYLAKGFVAGDSFTIADCAAAPYFLIAERCCVVPSAKLRCLWRRQDRAACCVMCRFGAKFSEFPNIKKYVATLKVGQLTKLLSMSQVEGVSA